MLLKFVPTDVHRRVARRECGFSMIEMVIVVLIALVLMGFAIPAINGALGNYRLHSAVASVTWAIQTARYQALVEGYPFQVTLNASNNSYQILSEAPPATSFTNVGTAAPLSGTAMTLNQTATFQFTPMGYVTATPAAALNNFGVTAWGNTAMITISNYGNITVTYGNGVFQ